MKKARFRLDFETEACFDIDREMDVTLPDGSRIVFNKSKKTDRVNCGTIIFEVDEPHEGNARNTGQLKVERFFDCMLMTEDSLEKMKPITFPRKPELLNREDFKGVPKTGYTDRESSISIAHPMSEQKLKVVTNLLMKISRLPRERQDITFRSLRWFRKASEVNGEDRFILRWISFEALLGLLKKEKPKSTQDLIPEFVDRFCETERARRICEKHRRTIEDLSHANLVNYREDRDFSEELRESLDKDKDRRATLPKVALCIFEVRNRLFHRGRAHELMESSSSLLRDITRECLNSLSYWRADP